MNTAKPLQQRGVALSGFIFGAFLVVLFSITGLKVIPAYLQSAKIKNAFVSIVRDPELKNATPREIQASFDKYATVDGITAIKPADIEISTDGGKLVLSASYNSIIPLFGNVSLYLEFNPSSAK
jgi:hypothetical protein